MTNYQTDCPIIDGIIRIGIKEWRLKYARRKYDFIEYRIIIGIYRWRRHPPLRFIYRLTNLLKILCQIVLLDALNIFKIRIPVNGYILITFPSIRITNLFDKGT